MSRDQIIKLIVAGWMTIFGTWPLFTATHGDGSTTTMIDYLFHSAGGIYIAFVYLTYRFGEKDDAW